MATIPLPAELGPNRLTLCGPVAACTAARQQGNARLAVHLHASELMAVCLCVFAGCALAWVRPSLVLQHICWMSMQGKTFVPGQACSTSAVGDIVDAGQSMQRLCASSQMALLIYANKLLTTVKRVVDAFFGCWGSAAVGRSYGRIRPCAVCVL